MSNLNQIYVPVLADGVLIRDSSGDVIANCVNPAIAKTIADAINRDARP